MLGRQSYPSVFSAVLVRLLNDPASPPALVNTCAVKLADAFGSGNYALRAIIAGCLRGACFRPSRILNRVVVVERIGSGLAENDPAARVLALDTMDTASGVDSWHVLFTAWAGQQPVYQRHDQVVQPGDHPEVVEGVAARGA